MSTQMTGQQTADAAEAYHCKVCNQTQDVMTCSRCKGEFYCSRQHQILDWKNHKGLCWQLNPPKIGETVYVTGILLPADEDQPRFVKIKCKVEPTDEVPGYGKGYMFDSTPFIGEHGWSLCVDRMGINGPALKNPFLIIHREMFLEDGSPINRCIQRITKNQAAYPWAGNILVMKHDQSNLTYNSIYVDATADDIPVVATYFSEYRRVFPTSLGGSY